ncbi:hypothetical protein EZ449_14305 [Pedobacter frigidisoli]|uniref:Uncharacterized protein n=1 Tax=Pedobacter frigidisoli TaxID=2530455 RepID=A0A4R0P2C0_9SPHI|nr:hypothetical protein [Pedobacter frigidisoli]TCD07702.1 hypothetical protein EZ449_14305 [Pedobacter frigidisoli]
MDQNNLEYLKKSLDYLGFGTRLNQVLEDSIYKKLQSFSIGLHQRYIPAEFRSSPEKGVDQMHFELRFNKSRTSDVYYLNAIEASLSRYNASAPVQKRFDLEKDNRMTALQCYKLLCGLSLQKDIFVLDLEDPEGKRNKRVSVWYKLNLDVTDHQGNHPLKWFFPEYGYDLEATFKKYPIIGMDDPEKNEAAIKALRYGNLISLEMELEGKKVPVYLCANPELRRLDIFDQEMRPLTGQQIFPVEQSQVPTPSRGGNVPNPLSVQEQQGSGAKR